MQRLESNRLHIAALAATVSLALFGLACDDSRSGYRSPTAPPPPPQVPQWSASWTFDEAGPAGDCLAEALNDWREAGGMADWQADLDFKMSSGDAHLEFTYRDYGPDGFWPIEFSGTIDSDGTLLAAVPAARLGDVRIDPWLDFCYWSWSTQGGQLSAVLSPDGRTLTGTVTETFQVVNSPLGTTFTIHSHFTATAP